MMSSNKEQLPSERITADEWLAIHDEAKQLTEKALGKSPEFDGSIIIQCVGILLASIVAEAVILPERVDLGMYPYFLVAIYGTGRSIFVWWSREEWFKQFAIYQDRLLAKHSNR
jgi:hypothetical protein